MQPGQLVVEEFEVPNYRSGISRLSFDMSYIPAGSFIMGAAETTNTRYAKPRHEVTLTNPFLMGRYEITHEKFGPFGRQFFMSNKSKNTPVENVSFLDVIEYCNWLSQNAGYDPAYRIESDKVYWNKSSKGFRLPTESEWEYAARAGEVENVHWPVKKYGWTGSVSHQGSQPVGKLAPNAWNLYDVLGNVFEMVWDEFKSYPPVPVRDPGDSSMSLTSNGIIRGGGYRDSIWAASLYNRVLQPMDGDFYSIGFRICRSL
jgi:formylglycine-generating enzyme required for sulfatase activity